MKLPRLAIGVGAGMIAALLLAPATGESLGKLAAARAERTRLTALAASPAAPSAVLAPNLALRARDAAEGRAAILARVERLAKAGGVLVEQVSAVQAPAPVAAVRVRLSGAEKAVLALADALERERPLMRLRSWQVEAAAGGVRLTGEVVAAWQ